MRISYINVFSVFVTIISMLLTSNVIAYAETGDRYNFSEEGNWIAAGGLNKYDYIEATTREEAEKLEVLVRADNYVLVNTDDIMIDDEEYELLCNNWGFWFTKYLDKVHPYWDNYRVYVYKPSFDDYIQMLKDNNLRPYIREELNNSTVVISYDYYDSLEKVGTITDDFNDNLPEWVTKFGYMEIRSSVDCELKILRASTRTYHLFYIKKGIPFLVKLAKDAYHIVSVNNRTINDGIDSMEDTLPYNNKIVILEHNTIDNPYIVELNNLEAKYNIKDMYIGGKPDYSLLSNTEYIEVDRDIDTEQTLVRTDINVEENVEIDVKTVILWIVLVIAIILGAIYILLTLKHLKEKDEDK